MDCDEEGVVAMDNSHVTMEACTVRGNKGPGMCTIDIDYVCCATSISKPFSTATCDIESKCANNESWTDQDQMYHSLTRLVFPQSNLHNAAGIPIRIVRVYQSR